MKVFHMKYMLMSIAMFGFISLSTTSIANTIVPFEKHSSRIVFGWVWKIPIVYMSWDWEKSSKVIPWPPNQEAPTNRMALLAGNDGLGSSTTFEFFDDDIHDNQIVLEDGLGNTQIYDLVSGSATYQVDAIDALGNAAIRATGYDVTATLISADIFNLGADLIISYVNSVSDGNIFLGQLDDPEIRSTEATEIITNLKLQLPSSPFQIDRNGYIGPTDLGDTFSIPEPATFALLAIGLAGLGIGSRLRPRRSSRNGSV